MNHLTVEVDAAARGLTLERFAIGSSPAAPTGFDAPKGSAPRGDDSEPPGKIPAWQGIQTGADGALRIGAATPVADVAESAEVRGRCAALAEAAERADPPPGRGPQTVGGNLCQRPRCPYYQQADAVCLKRGGSTCLGIAGESKYLAIFGEHSPCRMVSPSNLGVALLALDGQVMVQGKGGWRLVPTAKFFRLPTSEDPYRETVLEPGEWVGGVSVARQEEGWRSAYLQIPEKADSGWALVSAAASVNVGPGNVVRDLRLALNAVAPVPWRLTVAEDFLRGKRADETNLREAARLALADARLETQRLQSARRARVGGPGHPTRRRLAEVAEKSVSAKWNALNA